jgi:hypothetical protein
LTKPLTFDEAEDPSSPPTSFMDVLERLESSILIQKATLLEDEDFAGNVLRHVIDNPLGFISEKKGSVSGIERKVERHRLRGRTNKVKVLLYLSDAEVAQINSYVKHRGDRGPSDLVNQLLATALGALRAI